MEKKNILITGHNGLVGSALVKMFKNDDREYNVIVAPRSSLDLKSEQSTRKWFDQRIKEGVKIDMVICCAGKVGGIVANSKYPAEFLYDNALIGLNTISAAYIYNVDKLIYLGSSCVYPKTLKIIDENKLLSSKLEPSNEGYAIAKIMNIKLVEKFHIEYGKNYYSVMPCNVYGYGDNYNLESSHVIPALIRKLHEAKMNNNTEFNVMGNPETRREFTFSDTLAAKIYNLIEFVSADYLDIVYGTNLLNLGSGVEYTMDKLVKTISKVVGYKGKINWTNTGAGVERKLMDSKKQKEIFSSFGCYNDLYEPELSEGIKVTYNDFLTNEGLRK